MGMEEHLVAFGIALLASFALAVALSVYRRVTQRDLVEQTAGLLRASAPSTAGAQ